MQAAVSLAQLLEATQGAALGECHLWALCAEATAFLSLHAQQQQQQQRGRGGGGPATGQRGGALATANANLRTRMVAGNMGSSTAPTAPSGATVLVAAAAAASATGITTVQGGAVGAVGPSSASSWRSSSKPYAGSTMLPRPPYAAVSNPATGATSSTSTGSMFDRTINQTATAVGRIGTAPATKPTSSRGPPPPARLLTATDQ
eukprot:m.205544 g.205544  ORF g.205544 m.205544 type:complete len:204 (-) comp18489_c0_seq1:40-651(-)